MTIRPRRAALALLLTLAALLAACSSGASSSKPPTTAQLIQDASTNFGNDTAIHFTLTATDIAPGNYSVTQADGDVVRPDRLQVTGTDNIRQGISIGIGIIFIGQQQYVDLGGTGKYSVTSGLPDFLLIFDAHQGIGAILTQLQQPSAPTADTANGVASWKITGTVPSTVLAPLTGSTSTVANPVNTTLWIGQSDHQIHQVSLVGQATDGDTSQSTRTFVLSKYNEQVTISAPQV